MKEKVQKNPSDNAVYAASCIVINASTPVDLEAWRKRYRDLEEQMRSPAQQKVNTECEKSTELLREELKKLQEKLKVMFGLLSWFKGST